MSYNQVDSYKQDTSEPPPATGDPEFTHQQNNSLGSSSGGTIEGVDLGDPDPARKIIVAATFGGGFSVSVLPSFTLGGQAPDYFQRAYHITIGLDATLAYAIWDWPTDFTGGDELIWSINQSPNAGFLSVFRMVASAVEPLEYTAAPGSGSWNRALPAPGAILGVASNDGTINPSISNMTSRYSTAWSRFSSRVEPDGLATTNFSFSNVGGGGIRSFLIFDLSA